MFSVQPSKFRSPSRSVVDNSSRLVNNSIPIDMVKQYPTHSSCNIQRPLGAFQVIIIKCIEASYITPATTLLARQRRPIQYVVLSKFIYTSVRATHLHFTQLPITCSDRTNVRSD